MHDLNCSRSIILSRTQISFILDIYQLTIENGGLSISNIADETLDGRIILRESNIENVWLNSHFKNSFLIENLKAKQFNLSGSFEEEVEIESFNISNANFMKQLEIIAFRGTVPKYLKKNQIHKFKLFNCKFDEKIKLLGSSNLIKKLDLSMLDDVKGYLEFVGVKIQTCKIGGFFSSNLILSNCDIDLLNIDNLVNSGVITFRNINKEHISNGFYIKDSDLGKTRFLNFNLAYLKTFSFVNSQIIDSTVSGNFIIQDDNLIGETENDYENKMDFYKQLKMAVDKQGDRIKSLEYRALEFKYFKLLNKNLKGYEKVVLLGMKTNDFGLNFWKPFKILFTIYILAWGLITILVNFPLNINTNLISLKDLIIVLSVNSDKYFELLNPVHSLKSVYKIEDSKGLFLPSFFSFLYKLSIAFFSFQIVTSFRKYVKN